MEKEKKCFIVTPIGNENTEIRRMADGVISSVLKPILLESGYEAIDSRDISKSGSITNQVINHLLNDDLVIANLTGLNPNVMYELAVRHAAAKSLISICQEETNLPFDIRDERTIFYKNDMKGVVDLMPKLKNAIMSINDSDKSLDNPIYRSEAYFKLLESTTDEYSKIILQSSLNLSEAIAQASAPVRQTDSHQDINDSWDNLKLLMRFAGKTESEIEESIKRLKAVMKSKNK